MPRTLQPLAVRAAADSVKQQAGWRQAGCRSSGQLLTMFPGKLEI